MDTTKQASELKNIITGLLISTPLKLTAQQLWKDYKDMEGRNVPYRELGFASFEEYLLSIPETVHVYGSGPFAEVEAVVSSKTEHINSMVLKQKKSKVLSSKRKPVSWNRYSSKKAPIRYQTKVPINYYQTTTPINYYQTRTPINYYQTITPIDYCQRNIPTNYEMKVPINNTTKEFATSNNEDNNKNNSMVHIETKIDSQNNVHECKLTVEMNSEASSSQEENSSSSTSQKELSPVESQDNDPPYMQLNSDSSNNTKNTDLIFDDSESHSSIETNYTAPDLQKLEYLDVPQDAKPPDCVVKYENVSFSEEDNASRIPAKVQKNLKDLMQQFSDGIECTRLPTEYRKMFKRRLCYDDYGYKSLIEMCSDLPEIIHYVQQSSHDYMLYDKTKPVPVVDHKVSLNKRVQIETVAKTHILQELPRLDKLTSSALIPPDVLKMSDEINRLFPSDVVVGDLLEISIGEIYDLSKFWIYMTFGELDPLMKELQDFFSIHHRSYQIPELLQEEGLYCVALFSGQYHRCVIVDELHRLPHYVRVFFIDYGTVSNVHSENVWFLPKQFAKVPWQAIRARLSNIYPVYENRPWPADAVARFEELVAHGAVVGEITRVDEQDHVLEIYLADITNKENIFYINDIFVKEGLALYTDQERKRYHLVDHDCVPNVRYIHLYPEFYEIEAGLAPTIEDMLYINENKIPLHYYMPQYFDIHFYEDVSGIQLQHEKFNQTRISDITIPILEPDEFDFDFFPESLRNEMKELYEQENGGKSKPKSESGLESENNQSVKEYFCNKKRISELIYGGGTSADPSESNTSCGESLGSLEHIQNIVPLNNSLQRLSLSDSDWKTSASTSRLSTNPFTSDTVSASSTSSNPFRVTNPFLSDLEQTVNKSDLINLFTKHSEENLPQKIVNNLKDSHTCRCKMNKQTNIDKSPVRNTETPNVASGTTSSISTISNSPPLLEKHETTQVVDTPRRVRTPPGFSSAHVQNRPPVESNYNNLFNFVPNQFSPNSSYYPGLPFNQFNGNFLAPNQFLMPMGQPFMNGYLNNSFPQFYPNQYNFNPNWQHPYGPPRNYGYPSPKDKL